MPFLFPVRSVASEIVNTNVVGWVWSGWVDEWRNG